TYRPELASVMGVSNFPIGTSTEVIWSIGKVEVVLALDNTGSMAQNSKLVELKKAAHNLLDTLKNAVKTDGDARVAVVPFGYQVRTDPVANLNATWIRWDLWEETHGSCSASGPSTKTACQAKMSCSVNPNNNSQNDCNSAGTCSVSGNNSQSNCN